ncbi:MAG: RsmB/NOP family class I SAM-dependent RNA methyltransferase, partial [Candidatus Ranarchaeia archaeon]
MHPQSFIRRYAALMGDELENYLDAMRRPLPVTVRVNTLKIEYDEEYDRMVDNDWGPQPIQWSPNTVKLAVPIKQVSNHKDAILGYIYHQGAASTLPPLILKPNAGNQVLDLCAAPGSKTTQIAAMMRNQGTVIANEPRLRRLRALRSNLQKMGVLNTVIIRGDGRNIASIAGPFDVILVDAPCSSFGSLRKHPRLLRRYAKEYITQFIPLQKGLLVSAYKVLLPGGRLVYSTCSIEPEENELVVNHLLSKTDAALLETKLSSSLKAHNGLTHWQDQCFSDELSKTKRIYPQDNDTEGFYVALITKPLDSDYCAPRSNSARPKKNYAIPHSKLHDLASTLSRYYGMEKLPALLYHRSGKKRLWAVSPHCNALLETVSHFETMGLYFGRFDMRRLRLSFDSTILFRKYISKKIVELNDEQAIQWLAGNQISARYPPEYEREYVILKHGNDIVGCG